MKFNYPSSKKKEVIDNVHGVEIKDQYRWMEDNEDPEVLAWDKVQNDFTKDYILKTSFRDKIRNRLLELGKVKELDIPHKVHNGSRIFQYIKEADEEKWVLFTKKDENSSLEEILNPNKWDKSDTLHYYKPSDDGKYLAFGIAKGGNEAPELKIMEVESRKVLNDEVKGWKQYISDWSPDGSGLYYSAHPRKGEVPEGEEYYWSTAYYHKLGTDKSEDKKLYYDTEIKENWYGCDFSEDKRYFMLHKGKFYKNSIYFKGSDETELKTLTDDFGAEYSAEFYGDNIFISTTKDAPNKKIYVADAINGYSRSDWKEIIPEKEYAMEYFKIINGLLYVLYLKNASSLIQIYDLEGNYIKDVFMPTGTANMWGKQNDSEVWVWISSFTIPSASYKYDFENERLSQYFMPETDFRFFDYETKQVWYNSKDGTKVSMFIIKKKDTEITENTKVFMYAYGGFNIPITPNYRSSHAIWLESGGIIAIPNLRGGGEYGEEWHKAGMFENKQNVFDDYITAAEWLKKEKDVKTDNLVMTGGSNGGLLIGAMITQRPDLMKAVYCGVPLLDMIRYHNSMLANIWKEEYGSAEDPEQFKYIYKYSPYHNIKEGVQYPASIITAGINDARVDPYHARKFTAALRDANNSDNPILIQVQQASGHGGGTEISIQAEQQADKMAFLMDQVGLEI
ncbi:MAG: prolyl oligopeptidase family serine peptidase [Candidatus Delongbacteria bacterium]|nr:prolyl oligopeptidase family serine peptidase [Candidatus Delongbacteria bacterium]